MARYGSSSSSQVSSLSSKDKHDYYQLLHDFKELHDEANIIVVIDNRLKGLNNRIENKVNHLETELTDLTIDLENLDMIYNNSTYCNENQLILKPCEKQI